MEKKDKDKPKDFTAISKKDIKTKFEDVIGLDVAKNAL